MNPVLHFKMRAEEKKRIATFNSKAFAWKIIQSRPEMGEYVLATTTETDETGFPKEPGKINRGFL